MSDSIRYAARTVICAMLALLVTQFIARGIVNSTVAHERIQVQAVAATAMPEPVVTVATAATAAVGTPVAVPRS